MVNKICILDQDTIDRIEKCPDCDEAMKLDIECDGATRREHCECVNNEAPAESTGVKVILLAEAPPPNGRYLMNRKDRKSRGGRSFAKRVETQLQKIDGQFGVELLKARDALVKKELILDAMRRNGYTFIDCCQCRIPKEIEGSKMPLLKACFGSHAYPILKALCNKWPSAVVQPCFRTSYRVLRDSGNFRLIGNDGPFGSWRLQ